MSATLNRKQYLRVSEDQIETSSEAPAIQENFEQQMSEAEEQLQMLQSKKQEIERQRVALANLNERKQEFLTGQLELSDKFANSITRIERELVEMKQESDDLTQTRTSFAQQLSRIENLNPESWSKEDLDSELQRALLILDQAEEEFDQAASYFNSTRKGDLFHGLSYSLAAETPSNFHSQFRNGLAFNLPLLVLGSLALLVYLLK